MSIRIAHISDIHVQPAGAIHWRVLMNKRLTGLVNLRTFRKADHPFAFCEKLVAALTKDSIDHVVLTGDLTNLSLDDEFQRARDVLSPLMDNDGLTLIPGNHDKYVQNVIRNNRFEEYFDPAKTGSNGNGEPYPFVRRVGPLAIFGLNSAIKTPPFMSYGLVDQKQRERLVALARDPALNGTYKIVLLHHNLHDRSSGLKDWTSGLRDRNAFISTLFDSGANLVLHGHTHKAHRMQLERAGHTINVIGCGSSTWNRPGHLARYNVYQVDSGMLERIECRIYSPETDRFDPQDKPLNMGE